MSERQGYGYIQTLETTLVSASVSNTTGSAVVSEYNNITLQLVSATSGSNTTASATIHSSLDGNNWEFNSTLGPLLSTTSSALTYLTGRRGLIQARLFTSGSVTSSVFILAGQ